MANNYLLKYKTFDELLAEVMLDYKKYASNGMIDGAELIKVAQKINKRLGDKLRKEKETILYVEKGRVRLPNDFHRHLLAFMVFDYTVTNKIVSGDHREYREVESVIPIPGCENNCEKPKPCVRITECGTQYEIIETVGYETRTYKDFGKLIIKNGKTNLPHSCNDGSVNVAYIENKFLYTNFDEGKIYLTYLGDMEDEEGNLLVLDHALVNDYYEYALKRRIVENLMSNGETIPQNLFQIVETRYKEARVEGESLINMPDFAEMDTAHNVNRQAKYNKYYKIFQ